MRNFNFRNLPSLKLSFDNTRFNTDDKTKTQCFITCVLSLDGLTLLSDTFIKKLCKSYKMTRLTGRKAVRFTIMGQSCCHKDDEFDSNKGHHIAEAKAKRIAYNRALGILIDIYDMIEKDRDILCASCSNLGYLSERENTHIQKLKNENNN